MKRMNLIIDIPGIDKKLLDQDLCGDARTEAILFAVKNGIPISVNTDLVSRQGIINAIANTCFWLSADNWDELIAAINSVEPSAERVNGVNDDNAVPEREKVEWQYVTHYGSRYRCCPFCHTEKQDDNSTGWNFCQYCGADMRGITDDHT